ncbi:class I SAM-dependent methyltransferase [Brevundimonas sp.]|jgi:SAM-dependent methyltransferase|uniref:class I SAM-dependent methyltransferase n=1 Tax=Brevundimonas sp. TaxID=1871086 RepID=UPI001ACD84FF|nr:class I SAM-dependent methyltransferase [Brevundimonas sp.]MBN9464951.1 class I SAM-dependent methyltransferase [Brevundimonas sp.]
MRRLATDSKAAADIRASDFDATKHWGRVYRTTPDDSVSWYEPEPRASLEALALAGIPPGAALVDVGAGSSRLVEHLLDRGATDLCVVDIAATAFETSRARLGPRATQVDWVVADVTAWRPERSFDVWHDRALFHFLTDPAQRDGYRAALRRATVPGGWLIVATFAADGPERCSGLPVRRYDGPGLVAEFDEDFTAHDVWRDAHRSPSGTIQPFTWVVMRRR